MLTFSVHILSTNARASVASEQSAFGEPSRSSPAKVMMHRSRSECAALPDPKCQVSFAILCI